MLDYDDYADFIDAELHLLINDRRYQHHERLPSLAEELTGQDANERDTTFAFIERDMGHAY